jgi:hypothetical protein
MNYGKELPNFSDQWRSFSELVKAPVPMQISIAVFILKQTHVKQMKRLLKTKFSPDGPMPEM